VLLTQQSAYSRVEVLNEHKDRTLWSVEEMRYLYSHEKPTYKSEQRMIIVKSVMEGKLVLDIYRRK